jgi:hypothetical protein
MSKYFLDSSIFIHILGKGGVGKSTVTAQLALAAVQVSDLETNQGSGALGDFFPMVNCKSGKWQHLFLFAHISFFPIVQFSIDFNKVNSNRPHIGSGFCISVNSDP